jgi:hypothetical protein
MTNLTLAPEGTYSDIEQDFIENEPPGLFPGDQTSVWGQVRKTYADYLQVIADLLTIWYGNLDPATVNIDDIPEWEYMLDLPSGNTTLSEDQRRAAILARFERGPFTRSRRARVIESFIQVTFGTPTLFDTSGIPITTDGITLFAGVVDVSSSYEVFEDIPNFEYNVYVLTSVGADVVGMERELKRITPAGIFFSISQVSTLP